jgi:hypothetical protein
MTVVNPVQSELLPPPSNGNGAGTVPPEVVQQVAQAADAEAERKLAAIAQLGRAIRHRERDRDKQATAVAEKESELKTERTSLHKIEHEIEELHDELTTLATGKASERLPFKDSAIPENRNPAAPGSDDAIQAEFDAMPLATIGVKPALADKLVADGIRTGRDLRDWIGGHPVRKVQGVGPKAVENLSELMSDKMLAMKALAEEKAKPAAETFDDAAIKEDTIQGVASVPGLLLIQVGQRNGGQWSHRYSLTPTPAKEPDYTPWAGAFPTMQEAAVAAADLVDEATPKTSKVKKTRDQAAAIRRELDRMEKALKADTEPDVPEKVKKQLAKGAERYGELQTV